MAVILRPYCQTAGRYESFTRQNTSAQDPGLKTPEVPFKATLSSSASPSRRKQPSLTEDNKRKMKAEQTQSLPAVNHPMIDCASQLFSSQGRFIWNYWAKWMCCCCGLLSGLSVMVTTGPTPVWAKGLTTWEEEQQGPEQLIFLVSLIRLVNKSQRAGGTPRLVLLYRDIAEY